MLFLVLVVVFLVWSCQGQFTNNPTLDPPSGAGCTLVGQSIYCIGGENRNDSTWIPCTNTARRLDLADFNFELIFTLNWTVANSPVCTHDTVISTVQAPSNIPSVFVFGGDSNFNGTAIGYLLNPTDNSIIQTITDRTNSSLYATASSAGVTLPSGNVWMFGGRNIFNVSAVGDLYTNSASVLMYNVALNQMSVINANTPGNATRTDHTATLAADGSAIYIIGGLTLPVFSIDTLYQPNPTDLNIWSFNLASSQWQALTPKLNSINIGEARSGHTATLLPNSTSILIFGGFRNTDLFGPSDYALIYDYAKNTLSDAIPNIVKQNLNDVRSNSAVLYTRPTGESFIFFLFGGQGGGHFYGRVDILNITTPTKMAWLTNNNSPPPSSGSQGSGSQGSNPAGGNSSLSAGAIAGIAVGSAVAVFGVIGAFALWYIAKKKNRQNISDVLETDPRNDISNAQQVMETGTPDATTAVSDNKGAPSKSKPFEGSIVPSEDRTKPFESPEKPFDGHSQVPEELNEAIKVPGKPVDWSTKPFEGLNKPFDHEPA